MNTITVFNAQILSCKMKSNIIFSYGIICKDLPEDKKNIFESLLKLFDKKMLLIISLVVLFIIKYNHV